MRFRVYAMRFLDVTVLFPYTVKTLFKGTPSVNPNWVVLLANLAHPAEQHPRNVQVLGSSPRVGFYLSNFFICP